MEETTAIMGTAILTGNKNVMATDMVNRFNLKIHLKSTLSHLSLGKLLLSCQKAKKAATSMAIPIATAKTNKFRLRLSQKA
jgi:hypothetical protein